MKELRKKLALSAIVLLFALFATIGSTFAWFTIATTVSVNQMELNVTAENNLLVLIDDEYNLTDDAAFLNNPTSYKTTLTETDITSTTKYMSFSTFKMSPVTVLNQDFDAITSVLSTMKIDPLDGRGLVAANANSTVGHYISLDVWVMLQTPTVGGEEIVLNNYVVTADNTLVNQDAVIDAVDLLIHSDSGDFVFSNDPDYGFTFTEGMTGFSTDTLVAINNIADPAAIITTLSAKTVTPITTLLNNVPQLLTINIYVEGWDAETTNNIISSAFNVSFSLKIKE